MLTRLFAVLSLVLFGLGPAPSRFVSAAPPAGRNDMKVEDSVVKLARHPSVSPDASNLAFSWRGDIWTVPVSGGTALRLTAHPAHDAFPRWSPDGKWIAFTSNRNGNVDVFVMTAAGGSLRQLTYFSGTDSLCGWTPDSRAVVFTAARNEKFAGGLPTLYRIPVEGGQPTRILDEGTAFGRVSPDGKKIVYQSGRVEWSRKRYRGKASIDVWCFDSASRAHRKLTVHAGNDQWPMCSPDFGRIYYVSDEDETFNLWSMKAADGAAKRKLTAFKDDGVRFPEMSADGRLIAFEKGDGLWVLDTTDGGSREVRVTAPADGADDPTERRTFTGQASEFQVTPDGEQIAFSIRGELFVTGKDGGRATVLATNPARDGDMTWSPDGKTLIFVSSRDGNRELYSVTSEDADEPRLHRSLKTRLTRLTNTPDDEETNPTFSPDGKKLSFVRGRGDLYVADADAANAVLISESYAAPQFAWSPDSKWIAFTRQDEEANSEVFVIPATGGEAVNISRHPDNDFSPVWSADGRTLSFISRRLGNEFDIWFLYLRRSDYEKNREDLEDEEQRALKSRFAGRPPGDPAQAPGDADEKPPEKGPGREKPVTVEIDFENIHKRARRVTTLQGNETAFAVAPDGKTYAFSSDNSGTNDLYLILQDGTRLQPVTRGGQSPGALQWTRDQKLFFLSTGGRIQALSVPPAPKGRAAQSAASGPAPTPQPVAFQAFLSVDRERIRKQAFLEAWKAMNDGFYDPNFHGADWNACKTKYLDWAMKASCDEDFHDVLRMMIGELNSSHQGVIVTNADPDAVPVQTGGLGAVFDEEYKGEGLRVARVVKGSPADKSISRLNVGDIILSVNREPVSSRLNFDKIMNDTLGTRLLLEVAKGAPTGERRDVVIRPVGQNEATTLIYDEWVDSRRATVEKLSKGALGYLHIRGMDQPSLDRFEQELYSEAYGKKGLVIDVRDNGGGFTADYVLAIINVKPHAQTISRGAKTKGYPQDRLPLYSWTKPTTLLCNEFSYSNAEIFAHAFKTTKRGKLVGQQTYGAVISTGAVQLIDGSVLRMPGRGWYVHGTGVNEELNGAMPDIVVENQPGDEAAGKDRQLERAVEELMKEID